MTNVCLQPRWARMYVCIYVYLGRREVPVKKFWIHVSFFRVNCIRCLTNKQEASWVTLQHSQISMYACVFKGYRSHKECFICIMYECIYIDARLIVINSAAY